MGGDTFIMRGPDGKEFRFQSQVAILGWGYGARFTRLRRQSRFNRRWRFLGGDTILGLTTGQNIRAVSIAGGDSWVGIPAGQAGLLRPHPSFNRRWRFLGGDTPLDGAILSKSGAVSIAGGDSWVGIPGMRTRRTAIPGLFQSQVAILGWGYPSPAEMTI